MNEQFKTALNKPVSEIVRGDIMVFKDYKTGEWQRGLIYSTIRDPKNTEKVTGFKVLPIETVGKNDHRKAAAASIENTQPYVVTQAGGNPMIHKIVVQMNLQTVVNNPKMTGDETRSEVRTLGSINGIKFMGDVLDEVQWHYMNGQLKHDSKPIKTTDKISILPKVIAVKDYLEDRDAKNAEFARIRQTGREFLRGGLSLKYKDTVANLSLDDAVQGGHIAPQTRNFLSAAKMPGSQQAPQTLMQAFDLVTEAPDQLTKVFGMGSKGKLYQQVLADVITATQKLVPTP